MCWTCLTTTETWPFILVHIFIYFTELRERFDNGEDPLDPEQNKGGFNPFQGGGPFGHGGFTFKFKFN